MSLKINGLTNPLPFREVIVKSGDPKNELFNHLS